MASDVFGKAFAKASAEAAKVFEDSDAVKKVAKDADQLLREETAPMTANDAIQRILLAWKDRDYFRLLALPAVEVDALGKASWDCTHTDISKAYRKLSVLVHPDKNPGEEARQAFEYVNEAHRILKDAGKLADEKQRQFNAAQERQAKREATATVHERIIINALRSKQAKALRKAEEEAVHSKIAAQAKARQAMQKRKRDAAQRSTRKADSSDEGALETDDEAGPRQIQRDSSDDDADVFRRLARLQKGRAKTRNNSF